MMTCAQVVETSVTVTEKDAFQDYSHPDDHTTRSTVTPGFKPFTVKVTIELKKIYTTSLCLKAHNHPGCIAGISR